MLSDDSLKIIVANENNVEDIYKLEVECLQSYEIYSKDIIKSNLEQHFNLLAEINEEIVGYVAFSYIEDQSELLKICVLPHYQRLGVGSKLLKRSIDLLAEKNVNEIFLEVSEENSKAISFYEKFGFSRIAIRKNYYSNGTNAIIMKYIIS